ncbi:hypothetical protein [Litoribacillus peritrichatus]|uniref:Uncharacterized protein n=1 Tax=Litoribacillus peritrichatus TaxID=718191 RepID=A0ABP7MJS2_9GAMM
MIHESNSDIIRSSQQHTLANGQPAESLGFHNGLRLVLSANTLAMFKDLESVEDPLGNGLIASTVLSEAQHLTHRQGQFIESYKAGFVRLIDDRALLVTPNHIQLFPCAQDALRNQNEIAKLELD